MGACVIAQPVNKHILYTNQKQKESGGNLVPHSQYQKAEVSVIGEDFGSTKNMMLFIESKYDCGDVEREIM